MPDADISRNNASRATPVRPGTGTYTAGQHAVLKDISTMRTHLLANGYSAATVAAMTKNDMVYALSVNSAFNAL